MYVELGGKMVPFSGYAMLLEYEGEGIKDSYHFVRECGTVRSLPHGPDQPARCR
jgi:hypothetical protein